MAGQTLSNMSKYDEWKWRHLGGKISITFESNHCAHCADFYWNVDCDIRFPLPGNEWIDAYLVIRRKTQNYLWWSE